MTRLNIYRLLLCTLLIALTGCNLSGRTPSESLPDLPPSDSEPEFPSEPEPIIIPLEGTAAPTIPPNAPRDPCLEGTWIMPTSSLDLLMASVVPEASSFIHVSSGQLKFTFTDTAFIFSGDYILRSYPDEKGFWSEAHSVFNNSGSYTTEGNFLIFDTQVSESQVVECKANTPEGIVPLSPCALPIITILPADRSPYTCTQHRLEIETRSPHGPITMFFER
jgi:hypothetical protein